MEESALVKHAATGQSEAFRRLFETHHQPIFRFAYRLTNSLDTAEDIAQESLLRLVRDPSRFDPSRGSLRHYLFGMVRNLVRQWSELTSREVPLCDEGDHDIASREMLPQSILAEELAEAVQSAVAALPLPQREAIVLFEFEELSLEEAAAVLGVNAGAVKSRLHRGRERLKRTLSPHWYTYRPASKGGADATS